MVVATELSNQGLKTAQPHPTRTTKEDLKRGSKKSDSLDARAQVTVSKNLLPLSTPNAVNLTAFESIPTISTEAQTRNKTLTILKFYGTIASPSPSSSAAVKINSSSSAEQNTTSNIHWSTIKPLSHVSSTASSSKPQKTTFVKAPTHSKPVPSPSNTATIQVGCSIPITVTSTLSAVAVPHSRVSSRGVISTASLAQFVAPRTTVTVPTTVLSTVTSTPTNGSDTGNGTEAKSGDSTFTLTIVTLIMAVLFIVGVLTYHFLRRRRRRLLLARKRSQGEVDQIGPGEESPAVLNSST